MPTLTSVISSKQRVINLSPEAAEKIRKTEEIYRKVLAFYLDVIHSQVESLPNWTRNSGLRALEKLTVRTAPRRRKETGELFGGNPSPPYDIDDVVPNLPSMLRRAIITGALGMAMSWHSNYQKWLQRKAKAGERNEKRKAAGKNLIPFDEHPPKYPTAGRVGITFYKGMYHDHELETVKIKVYSGQSWEYIGIQITATSHTWKYRDDPDWTMGVPERVNKFEILSAKI